MELLRPQPIGIHSGAAMNLLVPNDRESAIAAEQLLRGEIPTRFPRSLQFYEFALQGKLTEAIESVRSSLLDSANSNHSTLPQDVHRATGEPTDLLTYNLMVLERAAGQMPTVASFQDPRLQELANLVAYTCHAIFEPGPIATLDGELRGWALATQAAAELEAGHDVAARQLLQAAVEVTEPTSPLLAAMLLSQAAEIAQFKSELPLGLIQQELKRAIQLAQRHMLKVFEGKLWLQLAMLLQQAAGTNRGALKEAILAFQAALQSGIDEQSDPLLFAEIQNSLGLAYLAMPASETSAQLRTGIAIQSFRKALEILKADEHPQIWARVNMNLANALQHAPSSHPVENLIQAVEIYEQILQVRTKAFDPISYALVTINQANALAHLGMFKPAMEKASEAYKLFQWYDQAEQATAARELVEQINVCLEQRGGSAMATATTSAGEGLPDGPA